MRTGHGVTRGIIVEVRPALFTDRTNRHLLLQGQTPPIRRGRRYSTPPRALVKGWPLHGSYLALVRNSQEFHFNFSRKLVLKAFLNLGQGL